MVDVTEDISNYQTKNKKEWEQKKKGRVIYERE